VDVAAIEAWYSRFQADGHALVGTVNALRNDSGAALTTDCALGRNQVMTLRSDLDDPVLRGHKQQGSMRGILLGGLDEFDSGFVLCGANDMNSAIGHLNAGIRLLNQATAAMNAIIK
jgi:hypothetical protein